MPSYKNFDKKLVNSLSNGFLPSFNQLRYIGRFLSNREKQIVAGALGAIALTAVIWLGATIKSHLVFGPKNGGEYSEAVVGQPKYINPVFSSGNEVDANLTPLVYSGLFRYSTTGKLMPDLASGYTVSTDQKTYTISLRQDVRWSDGEKFNANDVLLTFETIQNAEVGSPLYSAFQGVTVEKLDDFRVKFSLKEPFAPFLNTLTTGIIAEHIWGDIAPANMRLAKNNLQPVGTGPWKFEKMVKDDTGVIQSYTIASNPRYHKKSPYIQTAIFKFYNDYEQALEALRGKTVLAVSFLPNNLKDKITGNNLINHPLSLPQYTALFLNDSAEPLLKDANLRQALAMAIDKNQVVTQALGGNGIAIDSPILPGQLGYYPEIKKIVFDASGAGALLDKNWTRIQPEEYFEIENAALLKNHQAEIDAIQKNPSSTPEMASTSIKNIRQTVADSVRAEMTTGQSYYRKNKEGKILSLTITTADTSEYQKAAETIAKSWRALGIKVTIIANAARQINRGAIKDRDYAVLLYGELVGADPDIYPFWHSSQTEYPGLNLAKYASRTADKLLEDARATTVSAEREKLYKQFQDVLAKDLPAIFIYTPYYNFIVNREVKGITIKNILTPADRYTNLTDWYIKSTWDWK